MKATRRNVFVQERVEPFTYGENLGSLQEGVNKLVARYGERTRLQFREDREEFYVEYWREETDLEMVARENQWSEREAAIRSSEISLLNRLKNKYPDHKIGDVI